MHSVIHTVLFTVVSLFNPTLLSPVAANYHPSPSVQEQVVVQTLSPVPAPSAFADLQGEIESIMADYPDTDIAVVVRSLQAFEHISINGDVPMTAASTAKLLTALMYMDLVEQGKKSLDTSIGAYPARDQMEQLIRWSNNESWDLFISAVGFSKHNAYAQGLGMTTYEAKDNTMSAEDMAVLLTHMYQKDILTAEYMDFLLSFMQDTHEERFIPPSVPKGVQVYHKTGILEGYLHDGAIIDDGQNPFILVIFTENSSWDYEKRAVIPQRITQAVVDALIL